MINHNRVFIAHSLLDIIIITLGSIGIGLNYTCGSISLQVYFQIMVGYKLISMLIMCFILCRERESQHGLVNVITLVGFSLFDLVMVAVWIAFAIISTGECLSEAYYLYVSSAFIMVFTLFDVIFNILLLFTSGED